MHFYKHAFACFLLLYTPFSVFAANDKPCVQVVPGKITFYAPGAGGDIEGGFETSRPNVGGKNIPMTLDDVRLGNFRYVTLAANEAHYGKYYYMGTIQYRSPIDGSTYRLEDVVGYVHDTGGAFRSPGCQRWGTCADIGRKFDVAVGNFTGLSGASASKFVDSQADGRNAERVMCQIDGPITAVPRATFVSYGPRPEFIPDTPGTQNPWLSSSPTGLSAQQALQASTGQGATASGGTSGTSLGTPTTPGTNNDVPGVNSSPVPGPGVATLVVQSQSVRRGNPVLVAWSTLGMKTDAVCKLLLKLPAQAESEVAQGNGGARPVTIPIGSQAGTGEIILTCTPITGSALEKRISFTIE